MREKSKLLQGKEKIAQGFATTFDFPKFFEKPNMPRARKLEVSTKIVWPRKLSNTKCYH
jgi:hypothetical protein